MLLIIIILRKENKPGLSSQTRMSTYSTFRHTELKLLFHYGSRRITGCDVADYTFSGGRQ